MSELISGLEELIARAGACLPGHLGMEISVAEHGRCVTRMEVDARHHSPNGFLHAGAVVSLADTACGFGCLASLPAGAEGFATVAISSSHVGTLLSGPLTAEATLAHAGRTTQVWDARVEGVDDGRLVGLFRCTQLIM